MNTAPEEHNMVIWINSCIFEKPISQLLLKVQLKQEAKDNI